MNECLTDDRLHFLTRQDDRQAFGLPRADHFAEFPDLPAQDVAIEKEQSAESLILGGSADVLLDGQMREKRVDLRLGHLRRVTHVMEVDESLDPMTIGLLGPLAVMARAERLAQTVEECWAGVRLAPGTRSLPVLFAPRYVLPLRTMRVWA